MIVLGIDTSGYNNAVGLVNGERVLADLIFEARTDSLEKIVTNIDQTLQSTGLGLRNVQGIGIGLGPGSWTGIRVGVTVAKILAYSCKRPVCGVPTLEALAYGARESASSVCAVIGAGTGDTVYAALYQLDDDNIARQADYYVGDIAGLPGFTGGKASYIGFGIPAGKMSGIEEAAPGGAAVARLAARRLEKGDRDDALSLTPLYLKESTARAFRGRYERARVKKG